MARLTLPEPPAGAPAQPDVEAVRSWWADALWFDLCAYCLLHSDALELDHHEPRQLAPARVADPANLRIACRACNRAKSDYHPAHARRRRAPGATHDVHDVLREDFAELFELGEDGSIAPRRGATRERAAFLIALLNLGLDPPRRKRELLLESLRVCEAALAEISSARKLPALDRALGHVIRLLARQALLLVAHDVGIAVELRTQLEQIAPALARQSRAP